MPAKRAQMRIVYVQAHVEAFADVPLGTRAELIEREVWGTAVVRAEVHIDRRPYRAFDRDTTRSERGVKTVLAGASRREVCPLMTQCGLRYL
jgi:hypothetical protein